MHINHCHIKRYDRLLNEPTKVMPFIWNGDDNSQDLLLKLTCNFAIETGLCIMTVHFPIRSPLQHPFNRQQEKDAFTECSFDNLPNLKLLQLLNRLFFIKCKFRFFKSDHIGLLNISHSQLSKNHRVAMHTKRLLTAIYLVLFTVTKTQV